LPKRVDPREAKTLFTRVKRPPFNDSKKPSRCTARTTPPSKRASSSWLRWPLLAACLVMLAISTAPSAKSSIDFRANPKSAANTPANSPIQSRLSSATMAPPSATLHEVRLKPPLPWQRKLMAAVQSDARFIVAVMGRRAGKTAAAARLAGRTALDGKVVFWGAPTHDMANIGREKFELFYRSIIEKRTLMPADAHILNGGRVSWRSFDRSGAALGRGIDLAIVDEAARVRRQIVYEDLLPTISDTGGKIIAVTTPRGRRSWVFDWYTRARAGDPLYAVVHGPSTENPAQEVRDFVEIARANMPDALFRQEIMAEFVEGEGAVFRHVIDRATVTRWYDGPRDGCQYVIGCDLAKHQDYTVMYAMDAYTGEVHGQERFRHVDWPLVKARIANFAQTWRGSVWIDATGVGDPIFDDLCAAGLPVTPIRFTSESKSALVVALTTAMEKAEVSYPKDDVLIGELEAFAYEELPSGKFRYRAPEGMHDDCVIALALATWGKQRTGPAVVDWIV